MTVFILSTPGRGNALNYVAAELGFAAMGEEIVRFERQAFGELPLTRQDIVVGGISLAQESFARLGVATPVLEAMPPGLRPFAGRAVWEAPMGEVRRRVQSGETLFVKPRPARLKLFVGTLIEKFSDLIETAAVPDEEIVTCAEPVRFRSEYRCFVLHGDIVGVRHYKGDPLVFPDPTTIVEASRSFADAPAGYALDVGVLETGRTVVVEVNDGYASGAYGLAPLRYANVIAARWKEITA